MAEILIGSVPPIGHVGPLLTVAATLVQRGHTVMFLTSSRHAEKVRAVGAEHRPLPPEADIDESRLHIDYPERQQTGGMKRLNFDVTRLLVEPLPHQAKALRDLFAQRRFDAILVDTAFMGVLPMLLGNRANRPPVLVYSTTPLALSSRDTAPFGPGLPPVNTITGRLRNRGLRVLNHKIMLGPSQRAANRMLAQAGSRPLPAFCFDAMALADRYLVPTVPAFEYPRSDLPANVRFVGAVQPPRTENFRAPDWWPQLDARRRPVVHVTQGSVDNADLTRLLRPTIDALADHHLTVVATTGGRDVDDIGYPMPLNAFASEYVPHDMLLPKVDVLVTNGGYGAVQRALAYGVPMVVAGDTEDKPEVAARVAWSGAGINLRTGTPTIAAIRTAVMEVLSDRRYLDRARSLESQFAQRDGVGEIAEIIDELTDAHLPLSSHR